MPSDRTARAALFVDFDNVYLGLRRLDVDAAETFATDPAAWVDAVSSGDGRSRRFLIRIAYLNPSRFSKYRAYWTRAGFRVVDCPSLTQQGKSSTDINLVLDAVDVLAGQVRIDEFFIASADADFTSLVQRIRAADRLTTVIVAGSVASAYRAMADHVVESDDLLELVGAGAAPVATRNTQKVASADASDGKAPASSGDDTGRRAVLQMLAESDGAVLFTHLAHRARSVVPALTRDWGEFGSFRAWLEASGDRVGIRVDSGNSVAWDARRFPDGVPTSDPPEATAQSQQAPVSVQVTRVTDIPTLSREQFAQVFRALAADLRKHDYARVEATKRVRDALKATDTPVSRVAINFVVQGMLIDGATLDATASPESLAASWTRSAEALCRGARMEFEPEELQEFYDWVSGGLVSARAGDVSAVGADRAGER